MTSIVSVFVSMVYCRVTTVKIVAMLLLYKQGSAIVIHYIYLFLGLSIPRSRQPCLVIFNKIYVVLFCLVLTFLSGYSVYFRIATLRYYMLPTVRVLDVTVQCVNGISAVFFLIFASYARRNSIRNLSANMEKLELTFIKRFRFRRDKYSRKILLITFLVYHIFIFAYISYDYILVHKDLHIQLSFYISVYIMFIFVLQVAGHLSNLVDLIQFFNNELQNNLQAPVDGYRDNTNIFLKSYFDIWSLIESINYSYGYQIAFVALTMVTAFLNNINHFVKTITDSQLNRTEWRIMAIATWGNSCLFMVNIKLRIDS